MNRKRTIICEPVHKALGKFGRIFAELRAFCGHVTAAMRDFRLDATCRAAILQAATRIHLAAQRIGDQERLR
jgi:hypothetical protein